MAVSFVEKLGRIVKPLGKVCVATPNANEVIKPLEEGKDYSWQILDALLSEGFRQRKAYSLVPNHHALSVHRKKQLVAKIPGTSKLRDIIPNNLWEFTYGSGIRKVSPSDFCFVEGYKENAVDFLVFCRK